MTGRSRIVTIAALGLGLAAVAAVLLLTLMVGRAGDATSSASRAATPAPPETTVTDAGDGALSPAAETPDAPTDSQASAAFPIVDTDPIRLARTCPFIGHHAASYELLVFLTSVDNAIFALDPSIGHLALLADGTRRGQIEPVRLMAASGAAKDALRLSPALAPRSYGGPALFAQQFRLLRGLALHAGETQSRLIVAFSGGRVQGIGAAAESPSEAVDAVLDLVNGLDLTVEFRDNLIGRLIPFIERPRGC